MTRASILISLLLWLVAAPAAADTQPEIAVTLPDGAAASLKAEMLQALPRIKVTATAHDETHEYEGVALLAALGAAGLTPTESLRGKDVGAVVLVEAADGYRAAFALAELDPSIGGKQVLLADTMDGKPLPAETGTWRLVVPTDNRPARWVWSIVRIEVIPAR